MAVNDKATGSNSLSRRRARLRTIGVIVFVLGISSACVVYWIGTRAVDLRDDPSMAGYYKSESRQVEMLIGKMGLFLVDFLDELKRPDTQAIIIAAISTLVAFGCFYFAGLLDDDDEIR